MELRRTRRFFLSGIRYTLLVASTHYVYLSTEINDQAELVRVLQPCELRFDTHFYATCCRTNWTEKVESGFYRAVWMFELDVELSGGTHYSDQTALIVLFCLL